MLVLLSTLLTIRGIVFIMISFFPKQISSRAIVIYFAALLVVNLFFFQYTMLFGYMVLGTIMVTGFFLLTNSWSMSWRVIPNHWFEKRIFIIAVGLRLVWVIASYFYYIAVTGIPFEIQAEDSIGYYEMTKWWYYCSWPEIWEYVKLQSAGGISDLGYPLYLTVIAKLFGLNVIVPRVIKALISAYTCVLLYRLSSRTFGDEVGRMAGIMCTLMPNLIIYCGYHLKETEMLFLEVAFLERLDFLFRNKKLDVWSILFPTLLAVSLFFFRTVLGAAAVFSAITGVLLSSIPSMRRGWKRSALIGWGVLCLFVLGGGTIATEIESYWEQKEENVVKKRTEQASRGSQWAMYATGSVMAPMVVVLPFSTMINVDGQYAQQTKHGGNYIRNFMGFFAILAIFEALRRKKWRDFAMIGSFVVAYLGVVSLSGFANSERFLLPGLPGLIMMWAYGVSTLSVKTLKLLNPWCIVVFVMEFAWAYFKLGNRGLL